MADLPQWTPVSTTPASLAGGVQTNQIWYGTGVPANGSGQNGDLYIRADGGAGTTIYQKRAGAWVATAA